MSLAGRFTERPLIRLATLGGFALGFVAPSLAASIVDHQHLNPPTSSSIDGFHVSGLDAPGLTTPITVEQAAPLAFAGTDSLALTTDATPDAAVGDTAEHGFGTRMALMVSLPVGIVLIGAAFVGLGVHRRWRRPD